MELERLSLKVLLMLCQYKFISERKWITDSINPPYSVSVLSILVNLLIPFDKAIIYKLKEIEIEYSCNGGLTHRNGACLSFEKYSKLIHNAEVNSVTSSVSIPK
jgi:hypothetical protein